MRDETSDRGRPSRLFAFYVHDPRVTLLPIEHLSGTGADAELAAFLRQECKWSEARLALFDTAFTLYWQRSTALAELTPTWPAPRLRHVAVTHSTTDVRPYAQLLNTSAWTLHACDLDPEISHPELVAFLLAHGDRMAVTLEVTMASVQTAAWWFERTEAECEAFAAAASRSSRPDGDGLRAIAAALPWLRRLRHETLRPPAPVVLAGGAAATYRTVPSTGLLVPQALEKEPPALVARWTSVAAKAVADYHARWKPERIVVDDLLAWLEAEAPRLLVSGRNETVLWDPDRPARLGALRQELRRAAGAGVRDVGLDLRLVEAKSRRFLGALTRPEALPVPESTPEQSGYAYLHRERRLIAYNLREPRIERLEGPALPYARAMLGARTVHEWCHLAVDAGWVPVGVDNARFDDLVATAAELLDAVRHDAPLALRSRAEPASGAALLAALLPRLTDYRANLLAQRFLEPAERETYVRHNIRTLRGQYAPAAVFRMLARYLYEFQYLRFSAVADRRAFFVRSTWFDDDFFRTRILDETRFDALASAFGEICGAYAVDGAQFAGAARAADEHR